MCNNSVKWLYELAEDFSWQSGYSFKDNYAFEDKIGVVRLVLKKNGIIIVKKGYAWDGCTPKICLFDILFGIPDGVVHVRTRKPKAYYASLVHDALYQFLPDDLPLTRKDADDCFLKLMGETGFFPRYIYYAAVRIFGGFFAGIGRRIRNPHGRKVVLQNYA